MHFACVGSAFRHLVLKRSSSAEHIHGDANAVFLKKRWMQAGS